MADFKPPVRPKTPLDNRKLTLSAPCPSAPGKFSSMSFGLFANNPRITVYTNDPEDTGADKKYGKISANMDHPSFFAFLHLLKKSIDSAPDTKFQIENLNFQFFGGKRSDRPEVESQLWVGKDIEGVVFVSVVAKDRPKIKFIFGPTSFHHLKKGDGSEFNKAEVSMIYADSYVVILGHMLAHMAVSHWVEPEPKPAPGGQGGGNGGGNRGGYQGNNQRSQGSYGGGSSGGGSSTAGMEEDIPF